MVSVTNGLVKSDVPHVGFSFRIIIICFINDIPDNVTCGIKLFADDIKIYSMPSDQGHF